jgi:hypothetical protein
MAGIEQGLDHIRNRMISGNQNFSFNKPWRTEPSSLRIRAKEKVHFIFNDVTPGTVFMYVFRKLICSLTRRVQANVCIRGALCLSRQTRFRRAVVCGSAVFGRCLAGRSRLLKQCLYTLLDENLPTGVSFQIKVSCPIELSIGVCVILFAKES